MAQTKRKRRTKHRGNAAGTIEARGRTGRPPSPDERKKQSREQARQARSNRPPTWQGAIKRAGLAASFMFLFLLIFSKGKLLAAVIFGESPSPLQLGGVVLILAALLVASRSRRAAVAAT